MTACNLAGAQYSISEDSNLYNHLYDNLKFYVCTYVYTVLTLSSINLTMRGSPNDHFPLCAISLSTSSLLTYTVRRITNIIIFSILKKFQLDDTFGTFLKLIHDARNDKHKIIIFIVR
jgi:hypothetical protein